MDKFDDVLLQNLFSNVSAKNYQDLANFDKVITKVKGVKFFCPRVYIYVHREATKNSPLLYTFLITLSNLVRL